MDSGGDGRRGPLLRTQPHSAEDAQGHNPRTPQTLPDGDAVARVGRVGGVGGRSKAAASATTKYSHRYYSTR